MKEELDSVMKLERKMNLIKEGQIILSVAPNLIFKYIYNTYENIKSTQNKQLFEFFIINVKEMILTYILTSDIIINVKFH